MKFVEIMLDMLTSAYTRVDLQNSRKQKPPETNIGRLFSTFGWGLDIIRDNLERVRLWDDVDKAQGAVLDRYGRNFGVKRDGGPAFSAHSWRCPCAGRRRPLTPSW